MNNIITRTATKTLEKYLKIFPAVAILGSRQCGKSTLIKHFCKDDSNFVYIDMQDRRDLAKLQDPSLFFQANADKTICLDEVQLLPELFSTLRSEIDSDRRARRFVLLGSASANLIQKTSETLAGRIGMIDLTPFTITEVENELDYSLQRHWMRGGYPDSYLAFDDEASSIWRENFIRTYLERDIPQLGFSIAAPRMMRLLTLLAHEQGCTLNYSNIANSMGLTAPTIRHYIDILEQTYIVRILPPFFKNIRKRLAKTPRLYLRDSGLLHQILNISTFNDLLGHPVFGKSWEGLVVENVCSATTNAQHYFHRSANGDEEMDLVLEYPDKLIAIECKASTDPTPTAGFWKAIDTLKPNHSFIVCPIKEHYPIKDNITVSGIEHLTELISNT